MMFNSNSLLTTKLFIPSPRSQVVTRVRLLKLLEQGLERKLTLICAPAGSGKTTLVAQWYDINPQEALAWISLDDSDNEPLRFLRYLVDAFKEFIPHESETILAEINSNSLSAVTVVLTNLINALTAYLANQPVARICLVLDDYHCIQNDEVHNAVAFLLDHMPRQLHLIITSRSDPLLPLARLRARDQLLEIRANELRFQLEETAAFLEQDSILKATLTDEDIAQLNIRTEGWAVGLQLALLWLKGRDDQVEILRNFSGNNRFVLEYLAEEVLRYQPESVRTFLLQTSLLSRFNASLASAVTGLQWDREDLHQLEQANLFLISLDDAGEWYRYHHLFREFLQYLLKREIGEQLGELHLRASRWLEQNGLLSEAVEHALAAPDFHRAAELIEQFGMSLIIKGELIVYDNWLSKIPQEVLYSHPYLCLYFALLTNLKGQLTGLEKLLEIAEAKIKASDDQNKLLDFLHLRMHLAREKNNLAATIEYTEQTLAIFPEDRVEAIAVVSSAPSLVYINQGEVNQALAYVELLSSALHQKRSFLGQLFPGFILSDLYLLQGHLQAAVAIHEEILKISASSSVNLILCYLRLGSIYLEWNDIERAQSYLNKVEKQFKQLTRFFIPPGYHLYAGLWWPDGDQFPVIDWSTATDKEIEGYWQHNFWAKIDAFRARFGRKMGTRIDELEKWSEKFFPQGYASLSRPLEYQLEPQYLTLARVLNHQQKFEEALLLLEELKHFAQRQGRTHNLIKILILLTLTYQSQGNPPMAIKRLREALCLAEPGNYVTTFLEEGEALQAVLLEMLHSLSKPENKSDASLTIYVRKLLRAFEIEQNNLANAEGQSHITNYTLIEPLSERELEVLRLLAGGASNQEIASRLVVTLSTVKKHITSIFDKLGVRSRTQALLMARNLDLI